MFPAGPCSSRQGAPLCAGARTGTPAMPRSVPSTAASRSRLTAAAIWESDLIAVSSVNEALHRQPARHHVDLLAGWCRCLPMKGAAAPHRIPQWHPVDAHGLNGTEYLAVELLHPALADRGGCSAGEGGAAAEGTRMCAAHSPLLLPIAPVHSERIPAEQ